MAVTDIEDAAHEGPWLLRVDGRDYGPYRLVQLKGFAAQHRFVADSVVSVPGSEVWKRAGDDPVLSQIFGPAASAARGPSEDAETGPSTFIIFLESKGYTPSDFENTLKSFDEAVKIYQHLWMVQTSKTAAGLRNDLVQKIGRHDTLLIVDAGKAKGAWHNFGPEVEAKFRAMLRRR